MIFFRLLLLTWTVIGAIPLLLPVTVNAEGTDKRSNEVRATEDKRALRVLVVYYSRTENTKAMALEIVRRFNADLVRIETKFYKTGFGGWSEANDDAWNEVADVEILPASVDFSTYGLIFLGSPIWWYRPAVPLWAFVKRNDFSGKPVVLFNTFNSQFKQEHIDAFAKTLEGKGGRLVDHVYVRRGRWYSQMEREELLATVKELLDAREDQWRGHIQPTP